MDICGRKFKQIVYSATDWKYIVAMPFPIWQKKTNVYFMQIVESSANQNKIDFSSIASTNPYTPVFNGPTFNSLFSLHPLLQ